MDKAIWGGEEDTPKTESGYRCICLSTRLGAALKEYLAGKTFGAKFTGHIPDEFILKGKDAIAQFVMLYKTWDYSRFDVGCEVSANRKSVFLNWLFWCGHDFSEFGINEEQRGILLRRLQECWTFNHIDIRLPGAEY